MNDEILLITRLRTLNKGNQALSAAWLEMLARAFPDAPIRVLERRPRHLLQYTLRHIARARDPVAEFDQLASRLAELAPGPAVAGTVESAPKIMLDEAIAPPRRFVRIRQRLNLRGRLAAAGRYADEYRRRLSACQRAKFVVVNPAGEFFPREPQAAFYHLLDAYVAKKLGRPTAIVNHTMDIDDPVLRQIIPAVYRSLDLIGFRDEKSVTAFRDMGGALGNVLVTPDLALTCSCDRTRPRRVGTVALAINVPEATAHGYLAQWHDVVRRLVKEGFEVILVSNELPADQPFYAEVMQRFRGVRLEGASLDYDRYCELLSSYDIVVTSRMHTGILAMVAGTPVVAVEGSSFKITGLFQELGFQRAVIRPGTGDWVEQVVRNARTLREQRDAAATEVTGRISAARDRITSLLVPRLRATVEMQA